MARLLRLSSAWRRAAACAERGDRRIAALTPHKSDALLTSPSRCTGDFNQLSTILIDEVVASPAAGDNVGGDAVGVLTAERSPAFANMASFDKKSIAHSVKHVLQRSWSDCPFASEGMSLSSSWEALQTAVGADASVQPIRMPDPDLYKQYSTHFAALPDRYGMKFVEVASLDAANSVLSGSEVAFGGFHLMALVYFPSSHAFIDAWSDPDIVDAAYPLRRQLLSGGFEHLWLRCTGPTWNSGGCQAMRKGTATGWGRAAVARAMA